MGNIHVDIAPPSNWQDFERLTADVCRHLWQNPYAERHGRSGEAQAGVDVFGEDRRTGDFVGVQCKKRTSKYKAFETMPANTLTRDDIESEIKSAEAFPHPLDIFIVAVTAARDAELQRYVATRNFVRRPSVLRQRLP